MTDYLKKLKTLYKMANKTKLVKIHFGDNESMIAELNYPMYCELKNMFHNGNSWQITKIENI